MDNKSNPHTTNSKANALINELSPYLLQHAYNPVQWLPWSEAAFEQARVEEKPVFISIGYATCHWCHVMEHESFTNEHIAEILNTYFVCIKVDREERPDIDAACMEICQSMTGHGGWPLSMFMTPAKQPFYVGTYFPPETIRQRIGFKEILFRIASAWKEDRNAIIEAGQTIVDAMIEREQHSSQATLSSNILEKADQQFIERFDEEFGGFGNAPKFPTPHHILYLLSRAKSTKNTTLQSMALQTLHAMSLGGLHDHIGHGFHRYSTDREWHEPHFEKMLYDQALLLRAYTEAYSSTKEEAYKSTAYGIMNYVSEKLSSSKGGFYSAEDADSEGEEGTFYLFTHQELSKLLSIDDISFLEKYCLISEQGNFHDEASGKETGKNILHLYKHTFDNTFDAEQFEKIRIILQSYREHRIKPLLDDKILTDWNGLYIASLAYTGRIFEDYNCTKKAEESFQYVSNALRDSNGDLLHRMRHDKASIPAFCDDYAALALAAFELYQTTGNPSYIDQCLQLTNHIIELFIDESGKVKHSQNSEFSYHTFASAYDGAIPSAPSMIAMLLAKLGILTGKNRFIETAFSILEAYGSAIEQFPTGFSYMLSAFMLLNGSRTELVIAGDNQSELFSAMISIINQSYNPEIILAYNALGSNLEQFSPELAKQSTDKEAAVFICKNQACTLPIYSLDELRNTLQPE